tara:strand:- start:694 stop:891 length:198 start_codon:yes stop_codon:yes gene_type:complete
MTGLPGFFTRTSDGSYDRHLYKVVGTNGESHVVDDYMKVQEFWFNKGMFLSHVEILDKVKKKGFK